MFRRYLKIDKVQKSDRKYTNRAEVGKNVHRRVGKPRS